MGFFVFLCHNAAPKPYVVVPVSSITVLRYKKMKTGVVMRDFLNSREVSVHSGDQRNALPF